jgi:FdhD protein
MHFGERSLVEEVPVAIAYDGATYAVLMATPSDLEDFVRGFSRTEGIIAAGGEIAELSVIGVPEGIVLQIWLSENRSIALAARRRRLIGPAGSACAVSRAWPKRIARYRRRAPAYR